MKVERVESPYTSREEVLELTSKTREIIDAPKVKSIIPKRKKKVRTPTQKVLHWIVNIFYALIVIVLVTILVVNVKAKRNGELPSLFGYGVFMVETGSMIPTLPIGCYIVVREPEDPAALETGTIVTFYNSYGTIITHRIIEIVTDESGNVAYRTKGDNPYNSPDLEKLTPDRVIGTWQLTITLPKIWNEGTSEGTSEETSDE